MTGGEVRQYTPPMPAVSEKQRRFMGAELGRAEHGQKTKTGMNVGQLKDFATKPKGGFHTIKRG